MKAFETLGDRGIFLVVKPILKILLLWAVVVDILLTEATQQYFLFH